jgi:hypothetical protein
MPSTFPLSSRRSVPVPVSLLLTILAAGCSAAPGDPSAQTDDALSGSPDAVDIGFNGGADQFDYFADFASASTVNAGPTLCHWYVSWNVGEETPAMGGPSSPGGSRAYLEYWLSKAQGHCDEALITFQADSPGAPPTEPRFTAAFRAFLASPWEQETGFSGAISFTPWNEPNNPTPAGNGLGQVLEPELAARYYLSMSQLCAQHGCKVAAGDLASNGSWWNDFEWNCADDNVPMASLCKTPSALNPSGAPASYLDRYKNYIVNLASQYGLGDGFRPKYFAYHAWHDANDYLDDGNHCDDYGDCVTRRLLQSLGGSWGGTEIWDTEVGVEQGSTQIPDQTQACGAAFLLRLTTITPRIRRLYYTRLYGGGGELVDCTGGQSAEDCRARPALKVLAERATHVAGACR